MSDDSSAVLSPTSAASTRPGMGAVPYDGGVTFRVWAPFADAVAVMGTFNGWTQDTHPLAAEEGGKWSLDVPEAQPGHEYKFVIRRGEETLLKNDPYAREIDQTTNNAVIRHPDFDWGDDTFELPPQNELVVYELHVGTFNPKPGETGGHFAEVARKLPYLKNLGVNAIELMPPNEFPTERSWGYNPTYPFAAERMYGGPNGLKKLIKAAHEHGIGVIVDVVYNHFGPQDLDLWRFDGWSENNLGGIYFYNDARATTPWGDNRPDYGRAEVRQYIRDNALMWLEEYRADGLRFDMTVFIRTVNGRDGDPLDELPEGWSLLQWVNEEVARLPRRRITIAEDMQKNEWLVKATGAGGAGFGAQWGSGFIHPVRLAVIVPEDANRDMEAVRHALGVLYDGDAFKRVIYSESHDEVSNGRARIPQEIAPSDPASYFPRKRSTLAAGLVFTALGIPMLFQGQEFLEDEWFRDDRPLDWRKADLYKGVTRLYRDLIALRRNLSGTTRGLIGSGLNVHHVNNADKLIAFHRWYDGGAKDDVVVVANFSAQTFHDYAVGVPAPGLWKVRFNSDAKEYSPDFGSEATLDTEGTEGEKDGMGHGALVNLGPYSLVILSQD